MFGESVVSEGGERGRGNGRGVDVSLFSERFDI